MSGGEPFAISVDASIVDTALPIDRRSVSPAVPVTTIWSSATALGANPTSCVTVAPAATVTACRFDE